MTGASGMSAGGSIVCELAEKYSTSGEQAPAAPDAVAPQSKSVMHDCPATHPLAVPVGHVQWPTRSGSLGVQTSMGIERLASVIGIPRGSKVMSESTDSEHWRVRHGRNGFRRQRFGRLR